MQGESKTVCSFLFLNRKQDIYMIFPTKNNWKLYKNRKEIQQKKTKIKIRNTK